MDIFRVPFLLARSNRQQVAEETDNPRAFYLRYKKDLDVRCVFVGISSRVSGHSSLLPGTAAVWLSLRSHVWAACHRVAPGPVETSTYGERLQLEAGTERAVQNASPLSRI